MIQFEVSVPGKLSLFGEHAAKYGRAGLTGSIDLRTTLTFEEISNSDISLYVDYPHNRQTLNIPLEEFLQFYNHCIEDIESLHSKVLQRIIHLNKSSNHTMIVHAFYYLFIYIAFKEHIEIKTFKMQLSTEFLVNNDFACSASITVCFVVCLLKWSSLSVKDTFDDANLEKIHSYATHYGEISSQFGIMDVFTCLYGSLTEYRDGLIRRALKSGPNMTILLVDSKQKLCLDAQEQQVAELMNTVPEIVHSIFNSINTITKRAYDAFQQLVDIHQEKRSNVEFRTYRILAQHKVLETCIRMNQSLLNSLNVSHHHLDNICSTARIYGMFGQYTDIGNGRFAYIWCPKQHVDEPCTHIKLLADQLTMQGFHVAETKFARKGVIIGQNVENINALTLI